MLQMQGAAVTELKSISAVKPKRAGGHQRSQERAKKRRNNGLMWRRITAAFDDELKALGANPAMTAPLTRWVFFEHLTKTQGMAGRRYASIVREFERVSMPPQSRSARSANLEPSKGGEDQEIMRRIYNGTMEEYLTEAKYAKSQYKRAMKVLGRFADPVSGRNFAKDNLDMLCLADQELPANLRRDIGIVLTAIAKEFGIGEVPKPKEGK